MKVEINMYVLLVAQKEKAIKRIKKFLLNILRISLLTFTEN